MPSIATITVTYMSKDVFNAPLKSYKQLLAILPTNSNFSCLPVFLMSFLLLFCFCIPEIPVLEWCTVFFRDQPIPFITRAHFKNDVLQHLRRSIIKAWKIPISINTKVCPALFIAIVAWLKWLGPRRYTAEFADSPESDRGRDVNASAVAPCYPLRSLYLKTEQQNTAASMQIVPWQ